MLQFACPQQFTVMTRHDPAPLRELRDWLSQSVAAAEAMLPGLLDLPLPVFHLKLSVRPELRTAGMMQCLLDLAEKALGRFRRRAYELTSIAVEIVDEIVLPREDQQVAQRLRAQAWKTHARALRGIGRLAEAYEAISGARSAFTTFRGNDWYLATIDSIEAEILHSLGRRKEAAVLARRASATLLEQQDHDGYLRAMMTLALILREDAGPEAMNEITWEISETADFLAEESLFSRWKYPIGVFELEHGSLRDARLWLTGACKELRALGRTADAIAAHRALAEVAIRLGHPHEAISQRYTAYGDLLRIGALDEAAVVAAQLVELVLPDPRRVHEIRSFAASLHGVFEPLGMPASALRALAWLGERAEEQLLSVADAIEVRRYFEDLFLRPNAPFEVPDRTRKTRALVREEDYESALASLSTTANLYAALLEPRIAAMPERNRVLRNNLRLFVARAYARYPALRIFYTYDEDAVYLVYVELDDELAE